MKIDRLIFLIVLLLVNYVYAINFNSEYIASSFNMYGNALNSGMQESSISLDNKLSWAVNPACGNGQELGLQLTHFSYFSNMYREDDISYSMNLQKKFSLFFGLKWLDFGTYYDTRNMTTDVVYNNGIATTDSMEYWDSDKAVERNANEFLFKTVLNKKITPHLFLGSALNILYRDIEISNYIGSSIDVGVFTDYVEQFHFAAVVKNIGASAIKEIGNSELSYQPLYLQLGLQYKMNIMQDETKYITINLAHNTFLDFNNSAVVGTFIHPNDFLNLWGAYSLNHYLQDDTALAPVSFGFSISPKPFTISYSQKWDEFNLIFNSVTISFNLE